MTTPDGADDRKFGKSRRNSRTENAALAVLLQDGRFRRIDTPTKKRLLTAIGAAGAFGTQTFDAVMGDEELPEVDLTNIDAVAGRVRLIEMKATKKSVRDRSLNGFFFGATEREYNLAEALGDRFLFAFVVLSSDNEFGAPFFVLLTLDELEARTRTKRVQYQVNLRTDLRPDAVTRFGIGPAGVVDGQPPLDLGLP